MDLIDVKDIKKEVIEEEDYDIANDYVRNVELRRLHHRYFDKLYTKIMLQLTKAQFEHNQFATSMIGNPANYTINMIRSKWFLKDLKKEVNRIGPLLELLEGELK